MSLFWKIFLWFLLAMALIVGVSIFVSWSTQRTPFIEYWRRDLADALRIQSGMALQIYKSEGEKGLSGFIANLDTSKRMKNSRIVDGGLAAEDIARKALASGEAEFEFGDDSVIAAIRLDIPGNKVLLTEVARPRPPAPFGADWKTRALRISAIILTAGLLCYALARYLVRPIIDLGRAAKSFADGDLTARSKISRKDEIGRLSRDFDEMAERIENLILSQKRLTRDISHELRSPLARLNVALELAKQKSDPETQPLLERIDLESSRINEMISNILILSKLEGKSEKIEMQQVNLRSLLNQIISDALFEARGKGKTVKLLRADDCRLLGNERLLRSAIENVVRNAVRYSASAVEISLENQGHTSSILIEDDGPGLPDDELENIFQPFYRTDQSRERRSGGIGLGLAIAKEAINAHKGEISARSPGNGLAIEIKLPTT